MLKRHYITHFGVLKEIRLGKTAYGLNITVVIPTSNQNLKHRGIHKIEHCIMLAQFLLVFLLRGYRMIPVFEKTEKRMIGQALI